MFARRDVGTKQLARYRAEATNKEASTEKDFIINRNACLVNQQRRSRQLIQILGKIQRRMSTKLKKALTITLLQYPHQPCDLVIYFPEMVTENI